MSRGKARKKARRTGAARAQEAEATPHRVGLRAVLMAGLILLAAGGVVGLTLAVPDRDAAAAAAQPVAQPVTGASLPIAPGSQNPRPYQYDPVLNRHWDPRPGHMHWHPGPPPANIPLASKPTTKVVQSGSFSGGPGTVLGGSPSSATPNIANPQPWQYDPLTNKHWDPTPGHQHWHNGLPPKGK